MARSDILREGESKRQSVSMVSGEALTHCSEVVISPAFLSSFDRDTARLVSFTELHRGHDWSVTHSDYQRGTLFCFDCSQVLVIEFKGGGE